MEQQPVGLIAALPEEIKPLLRRAGKVHKQRSGAFPLFSFSLEGREVLLIESGMGMERGIAAAEALIAAAGPAVLVSFGLGGAVLPGPAAGDLVLGGRSLLYRDGSFAAAEGVVAKPAEAVVRNLSKRCREAGVRLWEGEVITSEGIVAKKELAALLPEGVSHPVLDMETWGVAQTAARAGVPLLALRAVSDGAEEELGFSIGEFTDREMNIRPSKVLRTVAGRPWIIPQLMRLAVNSKKAGRSLAIGVQALVELL